MGGSSGGGTSKTTSTSEPWGPSQPFYIEQLKRGDAAYQQAQGNQYFPGQTYANQSPETMQALNMTSQRARDGNPLVGQAQQAVGGFAQGQGLLDPNSQQYLTNATNGQYLDPTQNPYWNTAASDVTNRTNSQFGLSGRTGSGGHAMSLAHGLGDAAAGIYGNERNLQQQAAGLLQSNLSGANSMRLQAAGMAPSLAAADYGDAAALASVGQQREGYAQQGIDEQMARYNYMQNLPFQNLNNYASSIQGLGGLGGTQNSSSSEKTSSGGGGAMGVLGGIASIAGPLLMMMSSKSYKEDFRKIDPDKALDIVRNLPVEQWKYKDGIADSGTHVGPYAEDFKKLTGLGDGKTINVIDGFGILTAAIKSLANRESNNGSV